MGIENVCDECDVCQKYKKVSLNQLLVYHLQRCLIMSV